MLREKALKIRKKSILPIRVISYILADQLIQTAQSLFRDMPKSENDDPRCDTLYLEWSAQSRNSTKLITIKVTRFWYFNISTKSNSKFTAIKHYLFVANCKYIHWRRWSFGRNKHFHSRTLSDLGGVKFRLFISKIYPKFRKKTTELINIWVPKIDKKNC